MDERPDVLIIATREGEDPCIPLVAAAIAARGGSSAVVETARYPARLSLRFDPSGEGVFLGRHRLDTARAVWIRNFDADRGLPRAMDAAHRAAASSQAGPALWSALQVLPGFLLDPPEVLLAPWTKPAVQREAALLGLDVPRTLITNNAAAARRFARSCPTGAIAKLVVSGAITVASGRGSETFPTFAVDADESFPGLNLAPMIFQERLPKRRELRLTAVGTRMWAAAVEPGEAVDSRQDPALIRGFRACTLDAGLEQRLWALLDRLGLNFATIDLVETRDGRMVLLEVNSISYFDHIERHAGLPIADSVAALLLGQAPARVARPGTGATRRDA